MIFYRVDHFCMFGYSEEGVNTDEWFTTHKDATRRYNELKTEMIQGYEDDHDRDQETATQTVGDISLERIVLADMPMKELLLALLNQRGYIADRKKLREEKVFWKPGRRREGR